MKQVKLCPKKWSHFEDADYMLNLLRQEQDVLLIGPPRSGKSEVITDLCRFNDMVKINCFSCSKFQTLRKQFFESLSREFGFVKPVITFSNFLRHAAEIKKEHSVKNDLRAYIIKPITVVFENAQNLLRISNEETIEFFSVYERFVSEISVVTKIQTIVVSTTEMPLKYYKVYLPYPSTTKHRERITDIVEAMVRDHRMKSIFNDFFKTVFINKMLGYEIMVKDFDSIELVTTKLLHFLLNDMQQARSEFIEKISLDSFRQYSRVNWLFCDDINHVYSSINDLNEMIDDMPELDHLKAQANYQNNSVTGIYQREIMQNLPIIPSYILLACYLAHNYGKTKDAIILGLVKRTHARKTQATIEKVGPKKSFPISRVIWIVEALINNQRDTENVNDLNLVFHSNEFYLTFSFFERLNWLKQDDRKNKVPKHYQFTCDQQFVDMVIKRLEFKGSDFIKP